MRTLFHLVLLLLKNFCMNDCELAKSKKHFSLLLRENVKNKRTVYFLKLQHSVKIKFQIYFGSLRDFELISHFRYDKQFLMFYA